ncbi:MAG TPA: biotin transporter BioY [Bacillota bacterium]|nr:biotin transporter BioY [Bacillota bacterium]
MKDSKLKMMILSAMFAALTAICAQVSINLTPTVPMTFQTFAIGLTPILLGSRYGMLSVILYLFLGAIGLPVFANMKGGLQVLVGPTGGYLIGFVVAAYIIGKVSEMGQVHLVKVIGANLVGLVIIYVIGTGFLKLVTHMDWPKAIAVGVLPFLITDMIKLVIASILGVTVRKRLVQTGLLPQNLKSQI